MTASSDLKLLSDKYYKEDGTKKPDHYMEVYGRFFESRRKEPLRILELGISSGASLLIWRDYFPLAMIVGLDIRPIPPVLDSHCEKGTLKCIRGDQSDSEVLGECMKQVPEHKFDIIIDDASHVGLLSKASFDFLFPRALVSGGLYFIEDYGTGYMADFYDGAKFQRSQTSGNAKVFPSHQNGMVGWVKQLIDEMHGGAISDAAPLPIGAAYFWPSIAMLERT
jgi:23S rRNA U2552 (ribose-2'-O)-methylase RlmE/FtsJ